MKRYTQLRTVRNPRWSGSVAAQREADEAYRKLRSKAAAKRRRTRLEKPSQVQAARMKPGCSKFLAWLEKPRWEAAREGIAIHYRVVTNTGKRDTLHATFRNESDQVLVSYWPGTKRAIDELSKEHHFAATPDDALAIAIRVAHRGNRLTRSKS